MDTGILENYVIITKAAIKKILGCDDSYAYTVLNRLLKKNKIKKIIKGKYTTKDDIYLISTNLFAPSYLSFWSCSYFKGYTEQIVNTIQIATTRQIKEIEFENYKISFQKMPPKMFFGYEKKRYGDSFIFVADDEKLLIDSLYCRDLTGNPGEIIKMVNSLTIDKNKIVSYLKKINNKSLTKKTGFLLETCKGIDISKYVKYKDKNITLLFKNIPGKKINKKWQVKHDI